MKLRLKGNSIRLRLAKGEVERLLSEGVVTETVEFGGPETSFSYTLELSENVTSVTAEYGNGNIRIQLFDRLARKWATSENVGIEAFQSELRILIEKDFACMKARPGEDDSDAFPNPNNPDFGP